MDNYVGEVVDEEGTSEIDGVGLPADKLLFKGSVRSRWVMSWMCSNLTIKMSEQRYSCGICCSPLINCANVMEDVLRDLVPFVQFKKREKHPRKSVTFSYWKQHYSMVVFTFLNLYKSYQIARSIRNTREGFANNSHVKFLKQFPLKIM